MATVQEGPQKIDLTKPYVPQVGDVVTFRDVSGATITGPITDVSGSHFTVVVSRERAFQQSQVRMLEVFREPQ